MAEAVLVGLLFADRVITEDNHKKGIVGTFNRFYAQRFPVSFPPWAIYAAVTNLTGEHEFALNLVADDTDQVIVPIAGKFAAEKPTDVVELGIMVQGAMFHRSGHYNLTFKVDGEPVGARVLLVEQVEKAGG
jgi:hypothetical protein